MNAHVSGITLGVKDVERSKRFYGEGLGWRVMQEQGPWAAFAVNDGTSVFGLLALAALTADTGVPADGDGFGGITLSYVVPTKERVDAVLAEVEAAGGTIAKPASAEGVGRLRRLLRRSRRLPVEGRDGSGGPVVRGGVARLRCPDALRGRPDRSRRVAPARARGGAAARRRGRAAGLARVRATRRRRDPRSPGGRPDRRAHVAPPRRSRRPADPSAGRSRETGDRGVQHAIARPAEPPSVSIASGSSPSRGCGFW